MNKKQCKMMIKATELWGDWNVIPGRTIEGSFTEESGMMLFWFNTNDESTHVIIEEI